MGTNLRINEGLLLKAKRAGGFKTKRDTVNSALAEYVEKREQQKILSLFGGVDMAPDFSHKDLRAKLRG
jgi:Arc/MetJ family transcription regulator